MKKMMITVALVSVSAALMANVAEFDPRIAADTDLAPSDGLVWIDGLKIPLESKVCQETAQPYGRIPADLEDKVPRPIRDMSNHSTGHYLLFQTDSPVLGVRWECAQTTWGDPYIPPQGMYGVDIYARVKGAESKGLASNQGGEAWKFLKNGRLENAFGVRKNPFDQTSVDLPGKGMRAVMVYLPIRASVKYVYIGIKAGSKIEPWKHTSGIEKPVVHYGTSIVHGGCVSRAGVMFTSQTARRLDVPYVNLGFSGSAKLESIMADVMAKADASLYIVDTVWNCSPALIDERAEAFLSKLHALKPEVPILLCEGGEPGERLETNIALRKVYEKLKAAGSLDGKLHYLYADEINLKDSETTHDYCHPNDYGAWRMSEAFTAKIKLILGL